MLALRHARDAAALYRQENRTAFRCHSERSEESKIADHLALGSTEIGSAIQYTARGLVCQDVYVVFAQWLGILRRFTPQNDRRRAPSVILNGVKNPERLTAQRSCLPT